MRSHKLNGKKSACLLFFFLVLARHAFAQTAEKVVEQQTFVPQGFVETKDLVYFEIDKHGSKGSVEKVISDYNEYIVGKTKGVVKKALNKGDLLDKKGQPFDWKLRMDIIHPAKPSSPRPVFFIVSTSTVRNIPRHTPFQQQFAKRGYVTVIIDHAYSPLARVFGHSDKYYSLDDITGVKAYTAAIRYLRANAGKFSIDPDRLGGLGHSKGSYAIGRLSDPDINAASDEWKGPIEPYGPQPNLGFPSNIQVGYQSMGNGTRRSLALVKDNYAPMITAVGKLDPANHWAVWPDAVKAYSVDHDANWLGIPMLDRGHEMAVGFQPDLDYRREEVIEKFFSSYLEPNLPPNILYAAPYNDSQSLVKNTSPIVMHFSPQMDTVSVKNAFKLVDIKTNNQVRGNFKVSRKGTYFQFVPDIPLTKNKAYKLYVATGAHSNVGIPLSEPYEQIFTLNAEDGQKNRYGMLVKQTEKGCEIDRRGEIEKLINLESLRDLCTPYKYREDKIRARDYNNCTTQTFVFKAYNAYKLEMEVDIPKQGEGPFPFVIYVHGGGWAGGNLSGFVNQSKYLASKGIAGVRISYTLRQQNGHFDQGMEELDAALQFVKANAKAWNLDLTRFGYAGGSAGTPLASLAAMKNGAKLFIGTNGIYDFAYQDHVGSFPGKSNRYLRNYNNNISKLKEISPINHIPSKNPPAVIVFHGTADITIPYQQSVLFCDAIRRKGGRAEQKIYPNYMHAFYSKYSSDRYEEILLQMYRFAKEVFSKNEN